MDRVRMNKPREMQHLCSCASRRWVFLWLFIAETYNTRWWKFSRLLCLLWAYPNEFVLFRWTALWSPASTTTCWEGGTRARGVRRRMAGGRCLSRRKAFRTATLAAVGTRGGSSRWDKSFGIWCLISWVLGVHRWNIQLNSSSTSSILRTFSSCVPLSFTFFLTLFESVFLNRWNH